MSLLKKIKKVWALLSPWAPAKAVKKKRKKKASRPSKKKTSKNDRKTMSMAKKVSRSSPKKRTQKAKPLKRGVLKKSIKSAAFISAGGKFKKEKNNAGVKAKRLKPTAELEKKPKKSKRVLVGEVTHYFDRVKVAAFMVTGAPITLGDALEFEGKGGVFRQEIKSLQMDRVPVKSARAGDEVGILVKKPVKEGDYVFKVNLK